MNKYLLVYRLVFFPTFKMYLLQFVEECPFTTTLYKKIYAFKDLKINVLILKQYNININKYF